MRRGRSKRLGLPRRACHQPALVSMGRRVGRQVNCNGNGGFLVCSGAGWYGESLEHGSVIEWIFFAFLARGVGTRRTHDFCAQIRMRAQEMCMCLPFYGGFSIWLFVIAEQELRDRKELRWWLLPGLKPCKVLLTTTNIFLTNCLKAHQIGNYQHCAHTHVNCQNLDCSCRVWNAAMNNTFVWLISSFVGAHIFYRCTMSLYTSPQFSTPKNKPLIYVPFEQ